MTTNMTPYAQAKAWRHARNLTVDQLAELTGYSPEAIRLYERGVSAAQKVGKTSTTSKIPEWRWQRYRMICAGAEAQLQTGNVFNWGQS